MQMDEAKIMKELAEIKQLALLGSKNVLTVTDVAILLGVSKDRVYHLINAREIPFYKKNRRAIYFKRSEVEDWQLQNRQESIEDTEGSALQYIIQHS